MRRRIINAHWRGNQPLRYLTIWVVFILTEFPSTNTSAEEIKPELENEIAITTEEQTSRGNSVFGELDRIFSLPNTDENKAWWKRMMLGQVGKNRFHVLCALKDGNWHSLGDIRNYLDYQLPGTFTMYRLHKMLVLMAGQPAVRHTPSDPKSSRGKPGEGWLEKNPSAAWAGLDSMWRIDPKVMPLLNLLLTGCPENSTCE